MKDQQLITIVGTHYIRVAVRRPDGTVDHYISVTGRDANLDWQIGFEPTHTAVGSGMATVEGYNETTGETVYVNEAILKIQTTIESWRLKRDNGVYLLSNNAWFAKIVTWTDTGVTTL